MVQLEVEPYGTKINVKRGTRLLNALNTAGMTVRSECGGRGICGKCKVIIKDLSSFSETTDWKGELSSPELRAGYRLACGCAIVSDAAVYVPEESRLMTRKFLVEGTERSVTLEPAVRKVFLRVPPPSLDDVRSDARRVLDALKEFYGTDVAGIHYQLLKSMPRVLRDANWKVTAAIWDDREVFSLEKGDTSEEAFGIAVDIGTSKIIIYLSNLVNGHIVTTESTENPQIEHGEDVISRISYAMKSEANLKEMQQAVTTCLNNMISEACKKLALNPKQIYELTVVGNTAMHHLFLGIQPKHLGLSPYVPAVSDPINEKAKNLQLKVNPAANVYVFPVIAGFVGGDAVADIISTGIHEANELSLILDVGTNTEVVLGNKRELTACSCASGPAFEGTHIKFGMKAVSGAIDKLAIEPKQYSVSYRTIGSVKPLGLCGSAVIDAVASLLKCQLIDTAGKFTEDIQSPRLAKMNGQKAFVLLSKMEGATRDVAITQKDIREIQLAKAAIYTGCSILMKKRCIKPRDIKKLYIAGAFGNYINLKNAEMIGLLPDIPTQRVTLVGNAAGAGARMALISKIMRHIAVNVSRKVDYVELASEPDFQSEFTAAMFFPHRDLDRFPSFRNMF